MMEPPAKRLRILQSVEVDETNPDYIEAKQKQQQKLKSRFEFLFAKYEGMHESMSDEIDFKTGEVVVDRGHLRRVQRQMKRKEPTLLDSLLEPRLGRNDTPEEEEQEQAESEDELAPTQGRERQRHRAEDQEKDAQPRKPQRTKLAASSSYAAPTELVQENAHQIPNTPNPAANLLQHVQFPQTPLGQQAQAAFYANLNQTIAQAVQQAVAPLLSSVFQTTPNVQSAQAPIFPIPSPHPSAIDNVKPATDPKWYFPPMSITKDAPRIESQRSSPPVMEKALSETRNRDEASSPLIPHRRSPKAHIQLRRPTLKRKQSPQVLEASVERPQSSHSLPTLGSNANSYLDKDPSNNGSLNSKAKRVRSTRKKYQFTEEDDIYISRRKELHNMSFKEIQVSKGKWSDWPLRAFYNHWNNYLKNKQLHLQDTPRTGSKLQHGSSTPPEHEEQFFSSKEIPETSSASHRLPTPDSLEQDDDHLERAAIPSSSHFNDDELELLSLAGADVNDPFSTHTNYNDDDTYPTPDEPLPSIEGAEFRNEDELQLEMLKTEQSPTPEPSLPKVLPSTIPETQDSVIVVSSPSWKQKHLSNQKPRPKPTLTYRASSGSSDDLNLIGADEEPKTPHIHTTIKREFTTPQASRFLCSSPTFKTPRPLPQSSSTAAKSTGKLDRRAYLKEVKQSWAKAKGKTPGSQKRRSLNVASMARKRVRAEVEDSEDELAE